MSYNCCQPCFLSGASPIPSSLLPYTTRTWRALFCSQALTVAGGPVRSKACGSNREQIQKDVEDVEPALSREFSKDLCMANLSSSESFPSKSITRGSWLQSNVSRSQHTRQKP